MTADSFGELLTEILVALSPAPMLYSLIGARQEG
jgi:hypothetical protein